MGSEEPWKVLEQGKEGHKEISASFKPTLPGGFKGPVRKAGEP